jgi:hypothetical protein
MQTRYQRCGNRSASGTAFAVKPDEPETSSPSLRKQIISHGSDHAPDNRSGAEVIRIKHLFLILLRNYFV